MYQSERLKLKLPKDKDRRRKVSDEDRADILSLFANHTPIREITRRLDNRVSRRMVGFICRPERLQALYEHKKRIKYHKVIIERSKETWADTMRNHRQHRAQVFNAGKLPPPWTDKEVAVMLKMRAEGALYKEIALTLCRTYNSIKEKYSRVRKQSVDILKN